MQIPDEFIKAEMLAESYIESVKTILKLLNDGKVDECKAQLLALQASMSTTLAIGEMYDMNPVIMN